MDPLQWMGAVRIEFKLLIKKKSTDSTPSVNILELTVCLYDTN